MGCFILQMGVEGVDRCKSVVPCAGRAAAAGFQPLQKVLYQMAVNLLQCQLLGGELPLIPAIEQQERKRIPVRADGIHAASRLSWEV